MSPLWSNNLFVLPSTYITRGTHVSRQIRMMLNEDDDLVSIDILCIFTFKNFYYLFKDIFGSGGGIGISMVILFIWIAVPFLLSYIKVNKKDL